jgi:hypothetical protein
LKGLANWHEISHVSSTCKVISMLNSCSALWGSTNQIAAEIPVLEGCDVSSVPVLSVAPRYIVYSTVEINQTG